MIVKIVRSTLIIIHYERILYKRHFRPC